MKATGCLEYAHSKTSTCSYGAFHDWPTWRAYMTQAGYRELTHYYRPAGLPREQQPWLASVWRKPESQ